MAVNSWWGLSGQLPAAGGLPLRLRSLCLRGIRASHFPTARSTSSRERLAERLGWGRSPPTGCGIPRPQYSSIKLGRICGISRSSSATRISARQSALTNFLQQAIERIAHYTVNPLRAGGDQCFDHRFRHESLIHRSAAAAQMGYGPRGTQFSSGCRF
jgi:hypothetical protein